MEKTQRILITFEGLSSRAANEAALELKDHLTRALSHEAPSAKISIEKESLETQDFGTTLVVLLGTPAAIALAKGVHDYVAKRGSKVSIRTPQGEILATGDAAKNIDIAGTVSALHKL